jgi:2-polyprenyl-3-methyl-5-hydroxy-6-metoxy-1,4-benzoquinol methylase
MGLQNTGERVVKEFYQSSAEDHLIFLFHVATYQYALQFVAGKSVLDFGCGSGYGTALIAEHCFAVVGIDISEEAICYAKEHYSVPRLSFSHIAKIEDASLPFAVESFDVVLSFQVIEHIQAVDLYLSEIRRVLKPGGLVIFSTPDRASRLFSFQKPWNVWHINEYSALQLQTLLKTFFNNVEVLQMGGKPEMIDIELRRITAMKWLSLPLTLPFIPEVVRRFGLHLLKRLKGIRLSDGKSQHLNAQYSDADFSISHHENQSINLICKSYKTPD